MKKMRVCLLSMIVVLCSTSLFALELVRQKNVATIITFPIVDVNGAVVSSAAGLDSEYVDWSDANAPGTWADLTAEATEIGSTGWYSLAIAQGEMNYDYLALQIKTSTTGALNQFLLIRTTVGDPLNLATTDDGGTINVASGIVEANVKEANDVAVASADLHDYAGATTSIAYVFSDVGTMDEPNMHDELVAAAGDMAVNLASSSIKLATYDGSTAYAITGAAIDGSALLTGSDVYAQAAAAIAADPNNALILEDTAELQTDWADGGRLDLILGGILTDTSAMDLGTYGPLTLGEFLAKIYNNMP